MLSHADRLAALRGQLQRDRLDGFVVPLTDEHMSEYVGSYAQRLAWLTGFQGSAGSAVVLPEEAAIFVDGRYTLQVRSQVDGKDWPYCSRTVLRRAIDRLAEAGHGLVPCEPCGGTGHREEYAAIHGGRCFPCGGTGRVIGDADDDRIEHLGMGLECVLDLLGEDLLSP